MRSPATAVPVSMPSAPGVTGGHSSAGAHSCGAPTDLGGDHRRADIQTTVVSADLDGGHLPPGAQDARAPVDLAKGHSAGDAQATTALGDLAPGHKSRDIQAALTGGSLGTDHRDDVTQADYVGADLNGDQRSSVAHSAAVAESAGIGQSPNGNHPPTADPADALLLILADALDDLERTRIANENRLRSLRQVKGLENSKAEAKLEVLTEALIALEHSAELELRRALRTHPLGPWVKRTVGIGEKQGARLIAAIGDPAWNYAEDRPRRGPAELWAYCGFAPDQKRRKGVQNNWNADAKMRAFLCAEKAQMQRCKACTRAGKESGDGWNPPPPDCFCAERHSLRVVYDRARLNWADRTECLSCKGDCTDGHKKQHALRLVAKAILKDLWLEARASGDPAPIGGSPAPEPQDVA